MLRLRLLACCLLVTGCTGTAGVMHMRSAPDAGSRAGDGGIAGGGDGGGGGGGDAGTVDPGHPSADLCGNGLDDDGNGMIDEGCGCVAGATQQCHPDATVAGVGACAWGQQTCDGTEFGGWSTCAGAALPTAESCHDGVDNDCDGLLDCADVVDCGCACATPVDPGTSLVTVLDGYSTVVSCGTGCADLTVGRIGDNYWSGWCSIFEESTSVNVLVPSSIRSAVIENAQWDDYMRVILNGTQVWSGPDGNFPPETGGECELSTSWNTNPGVDVTANFMVGGTINFLIRVSVAGEGEGYARIRIMYDPAVVTGTPDCPPP